jgi:hypothetical protein
MTLHLMLDDPTPDDLVERIGHAEEFLCLDCGQPLDQLGSRCVGCEADDRADRAYERLLDGERD